VQPPAGSTLAHARPRLIHWMATAAALSAVLALSSLVQSSGATARPADGERVIPGPDPARAAYPVDCGGRTSGAVDVLEHGEKDFDGDGRAETVALVRCVSATGTPPSGIYVLAHGAEGKRPRVAETLLATSEGMSVTDFAVGERGAAPIAATLLGYSSPDVPRCCPDKERGVTWEWRDGRLVLVPGPVAGSV
jgi:hypothetical protein